MRRGAAQTELKSLWVIGHRVTPIGVGGRVAVLEIVTPVGTPGPPPHYHADCAEFFYVLGGRLGVMVDGVWSSLGPGDYVQVPRGAIHTFRNDGEEQLRTITGYDPPGFEAWFQEFGYDAGRPGAYEASISAHSLERVTRESERFQMILVPDRSAG